MLIYQIALLCSASYLPGNTNPNIKSQLTNVDDDNHDNDGNGDDDDDGKGGDVWDWEEQLGSVGPRAGRAPRRHHAYDDPRLLHHRVRCQDQERNTLYK